MKSKDIRKLAANPRFIPGVYNYCDRWCERCPLSNRCLNHAMEQAEDNGDPGARDLSNRKFWDRLHRKFQSTLEMLHEDARTRGIDLEDPKLQAEVKAQERAERRQAAKNRPLTRAAMAYVKAADKWFEAAQPIFTAKGIELETLARLEAGNPRAEAAELSEFVDIIRWYQHFIYVKLCRAIESRASEELETLARLETGNPRADAAELSEFVEIIRWYQHFIYVKLCRASESRASEELETDGEMKQFPKDSDGSAKIALMAMDRSISAWAGLREALGSDPDGVLDLLAQLAAIRRETEKLFPEARAFVRAGFDEPRAVPASA